jgi:hypothetical protein
MNRRRTFVSAFASSLVTSLVSSLAFVPSLAIAQTAVPPDASAQAPAPAPPPAGTEAAPPPGAYPPAGTYAPPPGSYPPPGTYAAPPGYYAPPPGTYAPPPGYYVPPPGYYPPPPGSYAPPYGMGPPPPGSHMHDGFYLSLSLGPSFLSASTGSVKIQGGGAAFGMAMGGALTRNVILYGLVRMTTASDPEIIDNGAFGAANGVTMYLVGLGGGIAYYLDSNVYVSGSLLATSLSIDDDQTSETLVESQTGLGGDLTVGKEWWASDNWGLGVAAQLTFASVKDNASSERAITSTPNVDLSVTSFAVLFSATFN